MQRIKKNLQQLLDKYLAGTATEEEKQLLDSWYNQFEDKPEVELEDKQWEETGQEIFGRIQTVKATSSFKRSLKWIRIAALWLLVTSVASFCYVQRAWILEQVDPIKQTERSAAKGTVIKLQLPDGTMVWLNGGSTIQFPEKFRSGTRAVKLSGEAYFDVAHNKEKPFIVYTGKIKTQVLGTAFNINAYADLENIKVAVTRGKVAVSAITIQKSDDADPVMLQPNQQVVYNKKTDALVKDQTDASVATKWMNGDYEFKDATMAEVALMLENRFNVKIDIVDPNFAKKKITGRFDHNDPLHEILDAFKETVGLKFQFTGPDRLKWH